jgi:hypothetical protein
MFWSMCVSTVSVHCILGCESMSGVYVYVCRDDGQFEDADGDDEEYYDEEEEDEQADVAAEQGQEGGQGSQQPPPAGP